MKCWICGNDAGTGEHFIKASDLRNYFGPVSQKKPLFIHTQKQRNLKVGSTNANRFKSKALICNHCNSSLTQPYDKAWERFSEYLQRRFLSSPDLGYVDLRNVFPVHARRAAIHLQLFFIKLFGCRIVESDIPIDIGPFSESLRQGKPLPTVRLGFTLLKDGTGIKVAGVTPVEGLVETNGKAFYATWIYSIGDLSVFIEYSTLLKKSKSVRCWRPTRNCFSVPLTNTMRWQKASID